MAAHWASWADTLPMIQERHPAVAKLIVGSLTGAPESPCLGAVHAAVQESDGVGFVVPEWTSLADGLRPEPREPEHHEPSAHRAGWQHEAASCVERHCRATCILPHLSPATGHVEIPERSRCRNSFLDDPSSCLTRLEPALFRVLLQMAPALLPVWPSTRRLWPPPCSLLAVRSVGEKCVEKQGGAWLRTSSYETWMWESQCPRQQTFGGGGRRSATLWWRAACCGHHFGVCNSRQWATAEGSC